MHWLLYNLPPSKTDIGEGTPKQAELADGSRQGRNGFGDAGYAGPCPRGQAAHHYVFNLYALDTKLDLAAGSSEAQLTKALTGHVIAGGQLIGVFQK